MVKEINCDEDCLNYKVNSKTRILTGGNNAVLKKRSICLERQKMNYSGGHFHPPKIYNCKYFDKKNVGKL